MAFEASPNLNHYYPATVLCKLCGISFIAMIPDGQQAGSYFAEKTEDGKPKRKCPRCDLPGFAGQITPYATDIYFFEEPKWEDDD